MNIADKKVYKISDDRVICIPRLIREEIITANRYIREHACYDESGKVPSGTTIELINFDDWVTTEEALNILKDMNYRSVNIYELIALITEFEECCDLNKIVAPGCFFRSYRDCIGPHVPWAKNRGIGFAFIANGYWRKDCYFAVIKNISQNL